MVDISSSLVENSSKSMTIKLVCGLDLGDKKSHVCVCTPGGGILERAKIDTTEPGLARYFQNRAPMRIALETGTHSPWVSRLLRRWGHEVLVANPRKVRLIGNSRRKNDRLDALSLADLASVRPRLLYPIEHVTAQAQADRGVLRSRDALGGGKTPKKRAIVAVARKLSVVMHRLLVTQQPYQPLRGSELQAAA